MKSAKKQHGSATKVAMVIKFDPTECPFREFRDNELSPEFWGMGPAAFRAATLVPKVAGKGAQTATMHSNLWQDEQTQPLPNSVRHYLDGWVRAEELALSRWESEVVVFEETNLHPMSVIDFQLSHAQVLMRSSFCRQVLSACFNLERVEGLPIDHQWDNFNFVYGPEGWRARYHIYSPGMKAGGGPQHRPTLSKNGCYLVRLFYLGAWRCVWVSDQVPVDASGAPLLPFSPLSSPSPVKGKGVPAMVTSPFVHLWPLLLCKALLKIAAPDMTNDEEVNPEEDEDLIVEDELMPDFDLLHTLTGGFSMIHYYEDYDLLWDLLKAEVRSFSWDDDYDDVGSSTVKSKSTRKPNAKDKDKDTKTDVVGASTGKSKSSRKPNKDKDKDIKTKGSAVTLFIVDTKDYPPYTLPGIAPGLEMHLICSMVRDLPLKRPLPEPDVALWKHYRWIDWARAHGLYEAYECPRTKFLKVNGLMKLSYAPHLLDVQSTESITHNFREEQQTDKVKTPNTENPIVEMNTSRKVKAKGGKDVKPSSTQLVLQQMKEELREWVKYDAIQPIVKSANVLYYPSLFEFTTAASSPSIRIQKTPNRALDIQAPKASPLYLQIDGPEENTLRISLSMLHPRILFNNNFPIEDHIEKAYVLLECFEWFIDKELPRAKAYVQTRGYDSVEVKFLPGRHYCRLWVHSRMNWHASLLSESTIILGTRDVIQAAACVECPWAAKFLNVLGLAFGNWMRTPRSLTNITTFDRDFFLSYQPDLNWDPEIVGYDKHFVHWMFRQALQNHLYKRLQLSEFQTVCQILRRYFCDPDFGLPPKPKPPKSLREIMERDPCDCVMPEVEFMEEEERQEEPVVDKDHSETDEVFDKMTKVSEYTMAELLKEPKDPIKSNVCELATEQLPCAILKIEREEMIKKHEAATLIQACWRGTFARKCLTTHVNVTSEIMKVLMDNIFGHLDVLGHLMNEFFLLFPDAKYAYSVSSALSGIYGLHQHTGISPVTSKCKWIPYFQGVFYCHAPVKVHFDVHSTIEHSTVQIYDNDTGEKLPEAYNAHITFDITPNIYGYTVLGHGSLNQPLGINSDIHWQLTVLTSMDNVFHVCDNNDMEACTILPLTTATKLHLDEMYLPNRRNILGGIQISISRVEAVSFRAAATTPDLEIEAILRTTGNDGEIKEVARCQGKGEIFWPYIRLKPATAVSSEVLHRRSSLRGGMSSILNTKSMKSKIKKPVYKSATKLIKPQETKTYTIEVIAPEGWALPINQWKRIEEVKQEIEPPKTETLAKKSAKEKTGSAKDKKKDDMTAKDSDKVPFFVVHEPLPEDAHIEIECSTTVGGGAYARRDDERDILYATALRNWNMKEPGRNARGAQIRQEFRDEYLVPTTPVKSESSMSEHVVEEGFMEGELEDTKEQHGPSPVTQSGMLEEIEVEEESLYYTTPEILKDKFIPLYFVPLCTKDFSEEETVYLTEDMAEAAKQERASHLEAAMERMRQLQEWNQKHVLGRQGKRVELLEKLLIDGTWNTEIATVMEERGEAINREQLQRQLSAAKKKMEAAKAKEQTKTGRREDAKKK